MTRNTRRAVRSIFLVLSIAFSFVIFRAMLPPFRIAIEEFDWIRTECVIEHAEILGMSPELVPEVRYRYRIDGSSYSSSRFEYSTTISRSDAELRRIIARYPEGSAAPCWVNPREPEDAVLQRQSVWIGLMFLLPAAFFLIGAIGLKVLWVPKWRVPISVPKLPFIGPDASYVAAMTLFFGAFMAVGLLLTYLFFLHPYLEVSASMSWPEQRCRIVKSDVITHPRTKDSAESHDIDLVYEYSVRGKKFVGTTYGLATHTSSSYSEVSAIVDSLAEGSEVPCFVDSDDPFRSTIVREFPAKLWFGVMPMLIFLAGLFGLSHALRSVMR